MCSNDNIDERISRIVSAPSPTTPTTTTTAATTISPARNLRSPKSASSLISLEVKPLERTSSTSNINFFQQLQQTPYIHYQHQLNHQVSGRNSATILHHPHHTIASMSSMLGGNNAVPPGILPPLDHYRLQLYNYAMAERLRCSQYNSTNGIGGQLQICTPGYPTAAAVSAGGNPYGPSRFALSMSFFHNRVFQPEEPKPQHSYIGLIAMAILNSPESKLVLSDIYQHILDNYPYFRTRGPGWRNSIRHNLSLNDCFIKAGRSANGKGHYWAIHPANLEDFKKGDFRRRKAQRKVRKHMGLAVDDDGTDSSSPPPLAVSPPPPASTRSQQGLVLDSVAQSAFCAQSWAVAAAAHAQVQAQSAAAAAAVVSAAGQQSSTSSIYSQSSRKRQFDVASLLAPDEDDNVIHRSTSRSPSLCFSDRPRQIRNFQRSQQQVGGTQNPTYAKLCPGKRLSLTAAGEYDESENEEDIDVVASDAENNNNNNTHSLANYPTIDDDNPTLPLSYNDDEDCIMGENLPKEEEINNDLTRPIVPINKLQHNLQDPSPIHVTEFGDEESPVGENSCNEISTVARAAAAAAAASWQGIIQQWPGNFQQHLNNISPGNVNTRILQRYYGQYMAAAAAQQAAAVAAVAKNRRNLAEPSVDFGNIETNSQKHQQSATHFQKHLHYHDQQVHQHQQSSPTLQRNEHSTPVFPRNDC